MSVCVPQSAVNSVMPQDFSSVHASVSTRYVCMCNLYRHVQSYRGKGIALYKRDPAENQAVSEDIDPLLPCKSSSGFWHSEDPKFEF